MAALLYVMAFVAGVAGAGLGVAGVLGATWSLRVEAAIPLGGLELTMDPLAGLFLTLVGVSTAAASLYAVGSRDPAHDHAGAYLAFVAALGVVPLAANAMTFLIAWEIMSVASWMLVLDRRDDAETRRAAWVYAVMTHAGLACLLAGMLLLQVHTGSVRFADWSAAAPALPASVRGVAGLLLALGFAGKAGVIPLHVWLPLAHPAAPSHVSALMSGVMIKLGVYGVLLFGLRLLGGGPAWWGGLVLTLGAVSALLGVLYALMEHDLKRLLAYHSIENIGIIFIGVGAGMMFLSYGLPALAVLGFVGGLYHTINHACFKGLLFLGAGSVLHATHTRNMEEMGGLIKRMPRTALFFLVGAAAISALPPLNGFVSEWVVFQALLGGASIPRREVAVLMPVAVAMLALASGLAAACFVKAFGITFLGIARSHEAEHAREAPASMQVAMAVLALACVVLGAAAYAMVPALGRAVAGLGGLPPASAVTLSWRLSVPLSAPGAVGQISPLSILLGLVILLAAIPMALWLFRASRALRVSDTWGCGRIAQTPRMQYTATAFAEPLRRIFAALYRPTEDVSIDFHPESRYFVQSIAYRAHIVPWFERYLYDPVIDRVIAWAARVRAIQSGSLHAYLTYLVGALVIMLGLLMLWGG